MKICEICGKKSKQIICENLRNLWQKNTEVIPEPFSSSTVQKGKTMRTILLTILIFGALSSDAQLLKVTATRQHWAGGVCCVTGTKYTISIQGGLDTLNQTEIKSITIDGNEFIINKPADQENKSEIFHYNFSISTNHNQFDISDKRVEELKEKKTKPDCLTVIHNNQEIDIPISEIKELMYLAYP